MNDYISAQEQSLILEKLYRSNDALSSTKKFNDSYQNQLGEFGESKMLVNDFARKMKKTHFSSYDVERFTKDVTGKTIDLETL